MKITGGELVALIAQRATEQVESERELAAKDLAVAFHRVIGDALTFEQCLPVFDIYRKYDLRAAQIGQNLPNGELGSRSETLVDDLAKAFETIPRRVLDSFVERSWDDYRQARSGLFRARSRASHVTAVLKPFKRRYFDIWEKSLGDQRDFRAGRSRIAELEAKTCRDIRDIELWAEDVIDLFAEFGVVDRSSDAEMRPMGTISSNSLRTYRLQWRNWIEENGGALIGGYAEAPSAPKLQSSFISAPAPVGLVGSLSLEISSLKSDSFSARQSWASFSSSQLASVTEWLKVASKLAAPESWPLRATFDWRLSTGSVQGSFEVETSRPIDEKLGPLLQHLANLSRNDSE